MAHKSWIHMTFTMSDGTALKILKTSRGRDLITGHFRFTWSCQWKDTQEEERRQKKGLFESPDDGKKHHYWCWGWSWFLCCCHSYQKTPKSEGEWALEERDMRSRKVSSFFFRSNLISLRGGKFITLQLPEWSKSAFSVFSPKELI